MPRNFLRPAAGIALGLLLIGSAHAQSSQALNAAGAPPKILNIVREQLIPGKEADYSNLLARIANEYSQRRIPVYWLGAKSLTGDSGAVYLNFFDSFAEAQAVNDALNSAMAANPDLVPMQEQLLTFTSSVTNAIAVRREGISYRASSVDFSLSSLCRCAPSVRWMIMSRDPEPSTNRKVKPFTPACKPSRATPTFPGTASFTPLALLQATSRTTSLAAIRASGGPQAVDFFAPAPSASAQTRRPFRASYSLGIPLTQ